MKRNLANRLKKLELTQAQELPLVAWIAPLDDGNIEVNCDEMDMLNVVMTLAEYHQFRTKAEATGRQLLFATFGEIPQETH